jgi:vacuolar protein sorting-associated protein 13A/C
VFTKPIQGAETGGVGGFFKGIGKGAAGLVTKTVSGTIDIVAKTTEGLDNQTKNLKEIQAASTRIRNPRAFYENDLLLRQYVSLDANWRLTIPIFCK